MCQALGGGARVGSALVCSEFGLRVSLCHSLQDGVCLLGLLIIQQSNSAPIKQVTAKNEQKIEVTLG